MTIVKVQRALDPVDGPWLVYGEPGQLASTASRRAAGKFNGLLG